jgi:lysophospholipase L1-like esterase
MRSLPLQKQEKRILVFGDSVLNGGSLTSHHKLATSIAEEFLQKQDVKIRLLNISAGSWGVDNAFAYMKKYGDFNATAIILVFSSHDAYDNMTFDKVVGKLRSYPARQPCCALWDGFYRYLLPKIEKLFFTKESFSKINKIDHSEEFNAGWVSFIQYAKQHHIPLYVILHPDKNELKNFAYNKNGKKIISLLNQYNIPYLLELQNNKIENYRDQIHYNNLGQKFLSKELIRLIQNNIMDTK